MYCRECGNDLGVHLEICTGCGCRPYDGNRFCWNCGGETRVQQELCVECGVSLSKETSKDTKYAGFWLRFAAYVIDYIVVDLLMLVPYLIGSLILEYVDAYYYDITDETSLILIAIAFVILGIGSLMALLYYPILHSSKWQATLGKMAVGIKVVDIYGNRISFLRAFGRYFATIISTVILFIGYIMAGFTEKKQTLHDIIAGTLVVKK